MEDPEEDSTRSLAYTYGKDMDLDEYFHKNKNRLPQLCVITGGIYGETKFDDFASDQVIRFQRYIHQKRVKMKRTGTDQCITVPMDTDLKFKVIKGRNNIGPEESLKSIMRSHSLPVLLDVPSNFPSDVFGPVTRQYVQLLAEEEISQPYLQGFCVTDEVIDVGSAVTILVIPEFTVAIIDGFSDRPKDKFTEHVRIMEDLAKKSKAKFKDDDVDKGIRVVEQKKLEIPKAESDSDNEYDYIEPPPLPKPRMKSTPSEDAQPKASGPMETACNKEPPPLPKHRKPSCGDTQTIQDRPLPAIPSPVDYASTVSSAALKAGKKQKHDRPYENDKVHEVNPMIKEKVEPIYEPDIYGGDSGDDSSGKNVAHAPGMAGSSEAPETQTTAGVADDHEADVLGIKEKNIHEIVDILRQLKLVKYCEMFEEDMIDGMTLKGFNEEDLKRDYGMRHAEAVRLMNYVRRGHIPK